MRKTRNRSFILTSALLITLLVIAAVAPRVAMAATLKDPFCKSISSLRNGATITLYKKDNYGSYTTSMNYTAKSGTLSSAKSSNKRVVEAATYNDWNTGKDVLSIDAVKPGKARVTYRYKGKKRTLKVVVKKYRNVFKSFKINNRALDLQMFKYSVGGGVNHNESAVAGKRLSIKPKSGWKISFVQARVGDRYKNMKNGGTIPKGTVSLHIAMQNKRDKGVIQYVLDVYYHDHGW